VTITSYRISKQRHAATFWTGNGARDYGGRWNSKGVAMVYSAENRSLAALEQLVHLGDEPILAAFAIASISFDDRLVKRMEIADLPSDWAAAVGPVSLRTIGDLWIGSASHPVLAVPSAIISGEWNYLFNPAHAEFAGMVKSTLKPFSFDPRLL
jgi:RES domain-containing protein